MNAHTNNLDTLRDRLSWRRADLMLRVDWLNNVPGPSWDEGNGRAIDRLLIKTAALLDAIEELHLSEYGEESYQRGWEWTKAYEASK